MKSRPSRIAIWALLSLVAIETGVLVALGWTQREKIAEMLGATGAAGDLPPEARPADAGEAGHLFKLTQLSTTPEPATCSYANCLAVCAAEFIGPSGTEPVALALPAFLGRRWTGYRTLEEGVTIAGHIVPFDDASAEVRRVDMADTIGLLDVPMFYCASWEVAEDPITSSADFAASLPPPGSRVVTARAPIDLDVARGRIGRHREAIASMLAGCAGGWDGWEAEARSSRERWIEQARSFGGAIRAAGEFYFEPEAEFGYAKAATYGADAASVKTLLELHRQLAAAGVHLIAVPYPLRDEVTFRYATDPSSWPAHGIAAPRRQQLIDLLLAEGVDVVDVLPWLAELGAEAFPFYDCADNHPANGSIVRVARGIADLLQEYGLPRQPAEIAREMGEHGIPSHRELFPSGTSYRSLGLKEPITTLPGGASVLLIGDSYLRTPGSYGFKDATLVDHLSWELGRRVSYVNTPAPEVFQALRRHRQLREAASVVVFVFAPSFFASGLQFRPYLERNTAYKTGSL